MSFVLLGMAGVVFAAFCVVVFKLVTNNPSAALGHDSSAGGSSKALGVDILKATAWDLKKGGVFSIVGFGDDYEDVDFEVLQVDVVKRGREVLSRELKISYKGRIFWLSVEQGDELSISVLDPRKQPRFSELGLEEEQLADFDDKMSGDFEWDGQSYYYLVSEERSVFENEKMGSGESFYYWEFESKDRSSYLCIEKWEGEPFSVSLTKALGHEQQVTIHRVQA